MFSLKTTDNSNIYKILMKHHILNLVKIFYMTSRIYHILSETKEIVISVIIVSLLFASAGIYTVQADIYYGNEVTGESYIVNAFGAKLANVIVKITYAYDDSTNKFVINPDHTFIIHSTWAAWGAYSNLKWTYSAYGSTSLTGESSWEMGTFIAGYEGYHRLKVVTTDTIGKFMIYWFVYAEGEVKADDTLIDWIPVFLKLSQSV